MQSDNPKSFRPASERWAAIKRTQQRMAPPPGGEDIGALLAESMEAYWAAKEKAAASEMVDTSEVFRRAAALFRKDFWSDFYGASIPIVLILLIYGGLQKAGQLPPDWLPWVGLSLALLLFAVVGLDFLRGSRFAPRLRYSVGALGAGLLMSACVGIFLFQKSEANTSLAFFALQGEIENIAVSSLQSKIEHGKWLTPRVESGLLSVQTSEVSHDQAVYRVSTHSLPGELVAKLGLSSGEVRWASRNRNSFQIVALASGRVVSVEDGVWNVVTSLNRVLELRADPEALGIQPAPGDCLIVVYRHTSKRNKVERTVPIESCNLLEEGGATLDEERPVQR